MNILFISSRNIIAADLARLLKLEGHKVKLFIDDSTRKLDLENMVSKTNDWKGELGWVGKKGLIVFDDSGYGKIQDGLRKNGYSVFGGNLMSDKLEFDREYAQTIFKKYGLQTLETIDFSSIADCIAYVKKSKKRWVVKQNDHKLNINFVSALDDNRDTLDMLALSKKKYGHRVKKISLQERTKGVEIGVGRFFNGSDWVGPVEINLEHKRFFNGDIGPLTTEMGTLAWYENDKNCKLFELTIAKMKPFLKEIDFRGDFEINFIINEAGIFPLEATPRLGSPIIYLQNELQASPWGGFLKAIADGGVPVLEWKKGYGIVVLLGLPPFPYSADFTKISMKGIGVYFSGITREDLSHIYFEGVARKSRKGTIFYISDDEGYALYVAAVEETVEEARKKVYGIINKIHIPKMFYRTDIGLRFIKCDRQLLDEWGYL